MFGNVHDNVSPAEEVVAVAEERFDALGAVANLITLNQAHALLNQCLAKEELFWKQKSRLKWLKAGDRNMLLFHSILVQRRARQFLGRIQDDHGTWLKDPISIRNHAVAFFQSLLAAPSSLVSDLALLTSFFDDVPSLVGFEDNLALLQPVSMQASETLCLH